MNHSNTAESSRAILNSFLNEYIAAKKDLSLCFKNLAMSFNAGFEEYAAFSPDIQTAIRLQTPAEGEIIVTILGEQYRYVLEVRKEQEVYYGLVTCLVFERTLNSWQILTRFQLKRDGETHVKFSENNYRNRTLQTDESGLHLFMAIANIHISGLYKEF